MAHLPLLAAPGGVCRRGGDRRRAGLRALAGPVPLRRAARRPRRGLPSAGRPAGARSTNGWSAWPRSACPRSAAASCSRASSTTSTLCRTCCCGSCPRSPSPRSSGRAPSAWSGWCCPRRARSCSLALLLAGVVVPWLTGTLAARAEARQAAARGELTASVVDLVEGAPELLVNGAAAVQLGRAMAADAELTQHRPRERTHRGGRPGPDNALLGARDVGRPARGRRRRACGDPQRRRAGRARAGAARRVRARDGSADRDPDPPARAPGGRARVRGARRPAAGGRARTPSDAPSSPHVLRVRGLRSRYPGAARWALDGIDLDLAPGRRVAVVGPSGAGKSTLAGVLLRFLPYQAGSVTLDGVELEELAGDECRRVVGLVAQDAHVFDTTLAENLRLARREATDEQLLRRLGARSDCSIGCEQLPEGSSTEVGERGARMSGGQRQRLALARALLADFPILVLDEPGEHLDTATADAILADLLDVHPRRATLLITHRHRRPGGRWTRCWCSTAAGGRTGSHASWSSRRHSPRPRRRADGRRPRAESPADCTVRITGHGERGGPGDQRPGTLAVRHDEHLPLPVRPRHDRARVPRGVAADGVAPQRSTPSTGA